MAVGEFRFYRHLSEASSKESAGDDDSLPAIPLDAATATGITSLSTVDVDSAGGGVVGVGVGEIGLNAVKTADGLMEIESKNRLSSSVDYTPTASIQDA